MTVIVEASQHQHQLFGASRSSSSSSSSSSMAQFGIMSFGSCKPEPSELSLVSFEPREAREGLLRQPKWGHLRDLHRAVKLCEPALVSGDPTITPLGNYQEAHVFKSESGACAAFLANYNRRSFAKVSFEIMHYNPPPWSISILPDCKNTIYNTARSTQMKMPCVLVHGGFSWQAYNATYSDTSMHLINSK